MIVRRRADLLALAGLAVAALGVFGPWLLAPANTLYSPWSDVVVTYSGWKAHMVRAASASEGLAYWNPTYFCGTPAYANPQMLWFHPLHLLFHVMAVDQAVAPTFLLLLVVLGWGTYVWLRLCGLDAVSAGIGALAGMLAPRLLYHIAGGFLTYLVAVACLPWVFAAVEWACARATPWRWGVAAAALSLMLTSGFVQLWLYAGYALLGYVLLRPADGWSGGETPARRGLRVPALAAAYVGSMVLGAYHFWPGFQFARETARGGRLALGAATGAGVPGSLWLTALLPQPWGDPSRMLAASEGRRLLWEHSVAFGLVPLLLCMAGRRGPHRRLWAAMLALAAVTAAFAWGDGNPVFPVLYRLPGVAHFRFPLRMLFVTGVALSGLVATGIAAWRASDRAKRPGAGVALTVSVGCALVAVYAATRGEVARFAETAMRDALVSLAIAGIGMIALLIARCTARVGWLPLVLILLLAADAARSAWWVVEMKDPAVVYPRVGPIEWLSRHAGAARMMDFRGALHKGMPGRAGVNIPDGYDPLQLEHTVRYMRALTGEPGQGSGNDIRIARIAAPRLYALLGARWVLDGPEPRLSGLRPLQAYRDVPTFQFWRGAGELVGETVLYEDPGALPRAFVVGPARQVAVAQEEGALPSLEPTAEVLLDVVPPVAGRAAFAPAEITQYGVNEVRVRAESDGPGYVVLTDAWYPAWQATRNGERAPVLRADGMFRAVPLPAAGTWEIVFRYEPTAERRGAWVTLAGLLLLTALAFGSRRPWRRATAVDA